MRTGLLVSVVWGGLKLAFVPFADEAFSGNWTSSNTLGLEPSGQG